MLRASFSKESRHSSLTELEYQCEIEVEDESVVCADCGNKIIFDDEQFSLREMVWHPQRKF